MTQRLINFSRSVRRQLLTTDLVYGLVQNLITCEKLNYKERVSADGIMRRINNIKHILYNGDKLVLSNKNLRVYSREVQKIVDLVDDILTNGTDMEFFNSVLLVVSDVHMNVLRSNNKKLRREWMFTDQMLNTFYRYRDTELNLLDDMAAGKLSGLKIMNLIK